MKTYYKKHLIEPCSGLAYIPADKCPKLQISNTEDCDEPMMFCKDLTEAKILIDEKTE